MIEAGLGIGILPRAAVRQELVAAGLRMVGLSDAWATRTLWVGVSNSTVLAPEAARLFSFMSESPAE